MNEKAVVGYWLLVVGLLTALRAESLERMKKEATNVKEIKAIELAIGKWRQPQPTTSNQQLTTGDMQ